MSEPSSPTASLTPTHQLADLLLDEGLREFVFSRRRAGVAWRKVARDLYERTDKRIDVAHETLRNWFPDASPDPDTPAARAS